MSLTYTSFAVAGAGSLGSLIVSELLKQGAQVTVLTRGGNSKIPEGVTTKVVDYTKPDELVAAVNGAEVVISALGAGAAHQSALADAAKAAGAKLFVPAEFGVASHRLADEESLLSFKIKFQNYLKNIGLPYTAFYTGLFADIPLFFFPGFDREKKTLANVGSEDVKVTLIARSDIAHFVAYTLTHLPASKLENARLTIGGETLSWKEIAAAFDKRYGGTWTLLNRDPAQVEKDVQEKGVAAFVDYVLLLFSKGFGDVGQGDNALVPGWTPLPYAQVLEKLYPA